MGNPYGLSSLSNSPQFASTQSSSSESTRRSSSSAYSVSSIEPEISCAASAGMVNIKDSCLQLKQQLLVLWKEGGELQYAIGEKNYKNREFVDKQQALNTKFMRKAQDYRALTRQANKCRLLRDQQRALYKNPTTQRALLAQIAKDLAKNTNELKAMEAEWDAAEDEFKRIEQAQTELQEQYQTYCGSLNELHEKAAKIWQQAEILLLLEKQAIKGMHAQALTDPYFYLEEINLIPFYIDNFEADFLHSYVMLKPSVYQMLRISISVPMQEEVEDPVKQNRASEEVFVLAKLLELERKSVNKQGIELRKYFSMEEMTVIKGMLTKEIRNARGKLAQEEIPAWRNVIKIENIKLYINALIDRYFEVSQAQVEIAQAQNVWLDYSPVAMA